MSVATATVVSPDVASALPRKRSRAPKVTSRLCDSRPKNADFRGRKIPHNLESIFS